MIGILRYFLYFANTTLRNFTFLLNSILKMPGCFEKGLINCSAGAKYRRQLSEKLWCIYFSFEETIAVSYSTVHDCKECLVRNSDTFNVFGSVISVSAILTFSVASSFQTIPKTLARRRSWIKCPFHSCCRIFFTSCFGRDHVTVSPCLSDISPLPYLLPRIVNSFRFSSPGRTENNCN